MNKVKDIAFVIIAGATLLTLVLVSMKAPAVDDVLDEDMMSKQAVIATMNNHVFVYTGPYSDLPQGVDLEICEIRNDTIWLCPNAEETDN